MARDYQVLTFKSGEVIRLESGAVKRVKAPNSEPESSRLKEGAIDLRLALEYQSFKNQQKRV